MKKLEPTRQVGEIAQYEDDPFALGEVAEGEMVIVKDFLPPPEELRAEGAGDGKDHDCVEQGDRDVFPGKGAGIGCAVPANDSKSSGRVCCSAPRNTDARRMLGSSLLDKERQHLYLGWNVEY